MKGIAPQILSNPKETMRPMKSVFSSMYMFMCVMNGKGNLETGWVGGIWQYA